MRRGLTLTLAAAFTAGGLAFSGAPALQAAEDAQAGAAAQQQQQRDTAEQRQAGAAQQQQQRATFPAGVRLKDDQPANELHGDIAGTLTSITEAALTENGFDDIIERLVDQDRNRIGEEGTTEQDFAELNGLAEMVRRTWKEKFDKDFDLDRGEAFTHLATVVGEIEDPQAVAAAWPVAPIAPQTSQDASAAEATASAEQSETDAVPAAARQPGGEAQPNEQSNLEEGRDIAIATLPGNKLREIPALNLSFVNEAGGWKLDVPNRVSGKQMYQNLHAHLAELQKNQHKWPVDESAAGLHVARHVLMGVYGIPVQQDAKQQQQGRQQQGQQQDAAQQPQPQQQQQE